MTSCLLCTYVQLFNCVHTCDPFPSMCGQFETHPADSVLRKSVKYHARVISMKNICMSSMYNYIMYTYIADKSVVIPFF